MTTNHGNDAGNNPTLALPELCERRDQRFIVPIEIEVIGVDRNGEPFRERTLTRDVSEAGCAFLLHIAVEVDDIIAVKVAGSASAESKAREATLFQVVRVSQEGEVWGPECRD